MRHIAKPLSVAIVLAALGLTGCGAELDELQQWMDQQRREVKPNVTPLSPPRKFDPQPYAAGDAVEPFSGQKLAVALKRDEREPSSLLAAELKRRKEPLEAYPLDSMSMVGSINKKGVPFALLKVDGLLYQSKVGDYLGQNYGRILRMTETELVLREVVQDAAGEWIERNTSLQLVGQGAGR
jgi:type IV pilus assembly protein PilP